MVLVLLIKSIYQKEEERVWLIIVHLLKLYYRKFCLYCEILSIEYNPPTLNHADGI